MFYEGIFRRPRLQSNKIISKIGPFFNGSMVNISGGADSDKDSGWLKSILGDINGRGRTYRSYFPNISHYDITNFSPTDESLLTHCDTVIELDLTRDIPEHLIGAYDHALNHTVLEHIFDTRGAYARIASMTKNATLTVVPFFQRLHDYDRGFSDYWRFTPFTLQQLAKENNQTVVFMGFCCGFSQSIYLVSLATKQPEKWQMHAGFREITNMAELLTPNRDGSTLTITSYIQLILESTLRKSIRGKRQKRTQ